MEILIIFFMFIISITSAWNPQMENSNLFEGDMILSPEQEVEVRSGKFMYGSMRRKDRLWLNDNDEAIVPYSISEKMTDPWALHEINAAINEYHKYTCIKFIPRTNEQKYIHFYKGSSCTSPVGRQGSNYIQLGPACWWRTTIMHEIGHSLGLYHEQSRPDRDKYVEIIYRNISRSSLYRQFKKESTETIDSLKTPYDYLSMMHYGWSAFGNGQMTIKTKDPKYQYAIGQDEGFSQTDVFQLNTMYKCISPTNEFSMTKKVLNNNSSYRYSGVNNKGSYPKPPPYEFGPPGCHNLVSGCSRLKFKQKCNEKSYIRYVREKCRKTCGLCGWTKPTTKPPSKFTTTNSITQTRTKTEKPTCFDSATNCVSLGRDKCNESGDTWKRIMKNKCRKFCDFC